MQECAREEADWNNNAAKQTHMNEKVHVCGPGMFPWRRFSIKEKTLMAQGQGRACSHTTKAKKRRSREAKENGDKFADAENDDKEEEEEEEIEEEEKTTQSNDRQW